MARRGGDARQDRNGVALRGRRVVAESSASGAHPTRRVGPDERLFDRAVGGRLPRHRFFIPPAIRGATGPRPGAAGRGESRTGGAAGRGESRTGIARERWSGDDGGGSQGGALRTSFVPTPHIQTPLAVSKRGCPGPRASGGPFGSAARADDALGCGSHPVRYARYCEAFAGAQFRAGRDWREHAVASCLQARRGRDRVGTADVSRVRVSGSARDE